MRLFLIRHGETVDNVAQVYAGVRDSALTNHGTLQADRLGRYFAKQGVKFTDIYSSDLQRAARTAGKILEHQASKDTATTSVNVQQLPLLREQDFGYFEGKSFKARQRGSAKSGKEAYRDAHIHKAGFQDVESKESMALRMNEFLDNHLIPILKSQKLAKAPTVSIVSHGIVLGSLWRCLLSRFPPGSVKLGPSLTIVGGGYVSLEHLGGWSNTGYLDLDIKGSTLSNAVDIVDAVSEATVDSEVVPPTSDMVLLGWTMTIKSVNGKEHLKDLKRTGGGVGSSKYDEGQKKIESFFSAKKRKIG
ncbi:hypothetical protein MMC25_002731 [Agyrium rufum]|nr:hypothetical protein [Agyrium rufum]